MEPIAKIANSINKKKLKKALNVDCGLCFGVSVVIDSPFAKIVSPPHQLDSTFPSCLNSASALYHVHTSFMWQNMKAEEFPAFYRHGWTANLNLCGTVTAWAVAGLAKTTLHSHSKAHSKKHSLCYFLQNKLLLATRKPPLWHAGRDKDVPSRVQSSGVCTLI